MARPQFRFEMGAFIARFESLPLADEKPLPLNDASLTERQRRTLDYVREKGGITNLEYQKLFELKERRTREELAEMARLGLLKRDGQGRATRYRMPD